MIKRPVLRYFGGKWRLAPWIISHFPEHRVYVEPFGGAGSVLIRKKRSYAEIYNDFDGEIVNVFKVLQNKETSLELERLIRLTPFSRIEYDNAHKVCKKPLERARRTIIRSFMGFGADSINLNNSKSGFRNDSNRSGATPAHDWRNYPNHIKLFCQRLQGVVIENISALELLRKFSQRSDYLFYLDPPYEHKTRSKARYHGYALELSDSEHEELIAALKKIQGMVILSGYESEIYDSLKWEKVTCSAFADGAQKRTECLWFNQQCIDALRNDELQLEFN